MADLLNSLRDIRKHISDNIQYSKAKLFARIIRLKILEDDRPSKTLLLTRDPNSELQFTLTVDAGPIGHRCESSIIFSSKLLTLKAISDLNDICFTHKMALSGIDSTLDGKIRLNICFYLGSALRFKDIQSVSGYITQCITRIVQYIYNNTRKVNSDHLDLSMFNETDLFMFNPQRLGEEKEFVYGTWKNFMRTMTARQERSPGNAMFDPPIEDLIACEKFESTNQLSMAEVGNTILEEILWHRRFSEMNAEEDYSVN